MASSCASLKDTPATAQASFSISFVILASGLAIGGADSSLAQSTPGRSVEERPRPEKYERKERRSNISMPPAVSCEAQQDTEKAANSRIKFAGSRGIPYRSVSILLKEKGMRICIRAFGPAVLFAAFGFSPAVRAQEVVKVAGEHNKVLFENADVRVIENTL